MVYTKINEEQIKHWLKENLSEERYSHTLGTAQCAKELAQQLGFDSEKAYYAGLLHDCAKCFTNEKLLEIIKENLDVDECELMNYKTLHAPVSAYIAERQFGVSDKEILSAIRWHTLGRIDMTDFEKLIFLASGDGVLCVDKETMNIKSFQTPEIKIYRTGIELSPDKYLILGTFYTKEIINGLIYRYPKYHYTSKAAIFDQKTGTFNMIKNVPIISDFSIHSYKMLNKDIVFVKTKYSAYKNAILFGFDTTKNEFYKKTYMAPSRHGTFTKLKDGTYLYTGGSGGGFPSTKEAYIFK